MNGFFVTATGTGVGKTLVSAALVAALRREGREAGVVKLVQTGCALDDPDGDAVRLAEWSGLDAGPEAICPLALPLPAAPAVAARAAGVELRLGELLRAVTARAQGHALTIVEGVGGIAVPLTRHALVLDAIAALELPVILVAQAGLGTINHTLLSLWALRARRCRITGVIFNAGATEPANDPSAASNPEVIARYGDAPILGRLPPLTEALRGPALGEWFARHVDLDPILAALG